MNTPKISVIIPVYNTEKFIRKCLDSVINQTFSDIEIICVDDCSPDDSSRIIQEYIEHDDRIKLIKHEKNLGQGGARNTAIKASAADFIASVDSDDSIELNMLEVLWEESNQCEYDIICCGYHSVKENGDKISTKKFDRKTINKAEEDVDNIFKLVNPAIWNKLWRKSLFLDNDIFFPDKLYYQDMATIPLLVAKAQKIKLIEPCLYHYLVRENSVTTSYSSKHLLDYFKVYEILYSFLNDNNLQHYAEKLIWFINDGMRYHGLNVTHSDMSNDELNQYLRHFLMLKIGFLEMHNNLQSKDKNQLLELLSNSVSLKEVVKPNTDILGVNAPTKSILNNIQLGFCTIFGFIIQKTLTDKQRLKYQVDPRSFFGDSKNKVTRAFGILFRII